ncbi:LysM peptidoglycan-binding domain-containing protein [Marinicrinis sediminis]|uniref:LysM peptidoglycan-binding domain-containing protein n=1 Tax=Marinicrinis sediminis TaxID=1652465 RepID=A0ABW5RDU6_9BACL
MRKWRRTMAGITASLMLLSSTAHAGTYTVQAGDSLWKISTAYSISLNELMTRNNLHSTTIYPGQILQVPGPDTYQVQTNETMWTISQKFNISLSALIQANPQIANPNQIWAGLTLNLPEGTYVPHTANQSAWKKPAAYADGQFPLAAGSYQTPLVHNYEDGRSWSPDGHATRKHEGVDLFADKGTPVYSAMAGEIISFGWNTYGGWRVTIRTDATTAFYYAHLSKYASGIGTGSTIRKGQLIGYVGNTGYGPEGTEGKFIPHLHFGIYKTSSSPWTSIDPYPYLKWWESH